MKQTKSLAKDPRTTNSRAAAARVAGSTQSARPSSHFIDHRMEPPMQRKGRHIAANTPHTNHLFQFKPETFEKPVRQTPFIQLKPSPGFSGQLSPSPQSGVIQRLRLKRTESLKKISFELAKEEDQGGDVIDTLEIFSDKDRMALAHEIEASGKKELALRVLKEWEGMVIDYGDLKGLAEAIDKLKGKKEDEDILNEVVRIAQQLDRAQESLKKLEKDKDKRALQLSIDRLRKELSGLQKGKYGKSVEEQQVHRPDIVITPAMRRAYREDMLHMGVWGGLDEGDAVARAFHYSCNVFTVIEGRLVLIQTIGTENMRTRALIHRGNHYEVVEGANDGAVFAQGIVKAKTKPSGDCLFEALYIVQNGRSLPENRRESTIGLFRQIASVAVTDNQVDAALTEIITQGIGFGLGDQLKKLLKIESIQGIDIKKRLANLKGEPEKGELGTINQYFIQLNKQKKAIRKLKGGLKKKKTKDPDKELIDKIKLAEETWKELEKYISDLEEKYGVKTRRTDIVEEEYVAMLDMLRSLSKLIKGVYDDSGKVNLQEVQSILIDGTIVVTGNSMASTGDFTKAVGSHKAWNTGLLNEMYETAKEITKSKTYAKVQSDDLYKIKTGLNLMKRKVELNEKGRKEKIEGIQETNKGSLKKEIVKVEKEVESIALDDVAFEYAATPEDAAKKLGTADVIILTPPTEEGWHAEQYLLVVVAVLLKQGTVPKQVMVSGVKEPCSACLAVLQEHRLAFWEATKNDLIFDTRPVEGASQKSMHIEEVMGKTQTHPVYKPGKVPNDYWKAFLDKLGIKSEI